MSLDRITSTKRCFNPECRHKTNPKSFGKDKSQPDGLKKYCRACDSARKEAQRNYRERARKAKLQKAKDRAQEAKLPKVEASRFRQYGLTEKKFDQMYEGQDERCKICKVWQDSNEIHIDHDHSTGRVRGLLCKRCNFGLGWFNDKPDFLETAAWYLRDHNYCSISGTYLGKEADESQQAIS